VLFDTAGMVFDPDTETWEDFELVEGDADPFVDQMEGVEVGGKLYFTYDKVYVFDPVALTVAVVDGVLYLSGNAYGAWALGGAVQTRTSAGSIASYDVAADTLTEIPSSGEIQSEYPVVAVHEGSVYVLSGLRVGNDHLAGVLTLPGSAYTAPDTAKHLQHRGFSPKQAQLLQADLTALPQRVLTQAGFSLRQIRTLRAGNRTMKALMRGGFNRHQARALTED
jgi:hypothetical protein